MTSYTSRSVTSHLPLWSHARPPPNLRQSISWQRSGQGVEYGRWKDSYLWSGVHRYVCFTSHQHSHLRNVGSHIARSLVASQRPVQISSRNPAKTHELLELTTPKWPLLPAVSVDVTKPTTLIPAFKDASTIISLVGVMRGTPKDFEDVQWKGAENVALAARAVGAKVIHFSAIGANTQSEIMYVKTKGMGENSVLDICPDATIIRPSIVFGPEDDFFNVGWFADERITIQNFFYYLESDSRAYLAFCLSCPFLEEENLVFSPFTSVTCQKLSKLFAGEPQKSRKRLQARSLRLEDLKVWYSCHFSPVIELLVTQFSHTINSWNSFWSTAAVIVQ